MGPFDMQRIAGHELESRNPDYCKDTSNTTLNLHNGKLLSAWYNAGDVYALDPLTLETSGQETLLPGL
jgi:carotenoid cleavage dioxygenase-like enzyme